MNACKNSLLVTLFQVTAKRRNHYATPPVNTLIKLLEQHHHKMIQRRWLFQCMRDLEDAGFITRQTRYRKNEDGEISQIPSLWAFTLKGAQYLFKKCVTGAGDLVKRILSWLNRDDKRWPTQPKIAAGIPQNPAPAGTYHLKDVLATVL